MTYEEPVLLPEEPAWLEPNERVLWHGGPRVDQQFRIRLWARGALIVAVVAVLGPVVLGVILGVSIRLTVVGAIVITAGVLYYVPATARRLSRTEYFLTSRRAVVVDARDQAHDRVTWAPLDAPKIRVKKRRGGSTDLNWGRSGGRISDQERPAVRAAQTLGFVDRPGKEEVLFVKIERPAALLGAIRSGRAALGLPPGFKG